MFHLLHLLLLLLVVPTVFFVLPLHVSKVFANAGSDLDADALLSTLPDECYVASEYTQEKLINGLAKPLVSSGELVFWCDKGLIWSTRQPVKETYVYPLKGKPKKVSTAKGLEILKGRTHRRLATLLIALVGADRKFLKKHFLISQQNARLQFLPKQLRMKKFLSSIELDYRVETSDIFLNYAAGEMTTIHVTSVRRLAALTQKTCVKALGAERQMTMVQVDDSEHETKAPAPKKLATLNLFAMDQIACQTLFE